eukprot:6695318-Heterocapsa_arctica.AAC.1
MSAARWSKSNVLDTPMRKRTARPPAAHTRRRRRVSSFQASALCHCQKRAQLAVIGRRVQAGTRARAEPSCADVATERVVRNSGGQPAVAAAAQRRSVKDRRHE